MRYRSTYRVLLIDDDPAALDEFRRIAQAYIGPRFDSLDETASDDAVLFPAWLQVDSVSRGWEGWELVRAAVDDQQSFGMVLIDLHLQPDWDGVETATRIRDLDPSLAVVFVVENPPTSWEGITRQLGGLANYDVVSKPFVPAQLLQTIAWQCKHQELRQECDQLALQLEAAEQTIERMHHEAGNSGAMDFKLLDDFTHKIRSPMHTLLGFSEQLLKEPLGPDGLRRLKYVNQAGKSLSRLVDDLLDYCELADGRVQLSLTSFELDAVVHDVLQETADAARVKNLAVAYRPDPAIPRVLEGAESRLCKVLLHVVENAVRFTEQGSVSIETALMAEDDQSATVRIAVIDTGVGIPSEKQAGLLEGSVGRDTGAASVSHGLGVGLAICRELVRLMGGRMGVVSAPGQGSTFWFTVILRKQRVRASSVARPMREAVLAEGDPSNPASFAVQPLQCHGDVS